VADEDPLTPGEIRRSLKRLEDEDRAQVARLTQLAAETLPVKLWDAEHRALTEQLHRHEKESADRTARLERSLDAYKASCDKRTEDIEDDVQKLREERDRRSELTWQKVISLIAALAGVAAVIVAVLGQTKGIK
jgi:Flp pilus assembly protein TadB